MEKVEFDSGWYLGTNKKATSIEVAFLFKLFYLKRFLFLFCFLHWVIWPVDCDAPCCVALNTWNFVGGISYRPCVISFIDVSCFSHRIKFYFEPLLYPS